MSKYFYNYNPATKEYTYKEEAYINPVATAREGKNIYSLPANATFEKPPTTKTYEIAVFENNGWQIKADYRGMYKVNSDMKPELIEQIGSLDDGFIAITETQAKKIFEDNLFYIIENNKLIVNPDYEEQKAAREQEKINKLKMTALDFINILVGFGLSLQQINAYLEANLEVKMQLTYCQNVYCGVVKALMPITIEEITITADMVEQAFIAKGN